MKRDLSNQLTLGVGLKDEATFANFYVGGNHELVTLLQKAAKNEGERMIYVYGAPGDGRTHLLQAACHEANHAGLRTGYIPLAHVNELSPHLLEGLEVLDLICMDDVHMIAGLPLWEERLFHAYNRIYDAGKRLIVTANVPPKRLSFKLPDVVSRLAWGVVYALQPLNDDEKLYALMMRAERRGMSLLSEVGKYILKHCPRHMSTLFAVLEALDKASLAEQRKLTIPFIKEVLQI